MMPINASEEICIALIDWCKYHYGGNLVSLALFDPKLVTANYPYSEINILVGLQTAPEQERKRYEQIGEILLKNLIPRNEIACRIQTIEELDALAQLKLPLLEIYLKHANIIYDPKGILQSVRTLL